MIGNCKNIKENYPRKSFWTQEKETWVKFNPKLGANRPSNNWAQVFLCFEYWLLKWLALLTTERENYIQVSNLFPSWKKLGVNEIFITSGGDIGNASENWSENYRQEA